MDNLTKAGKLTRVINATAAGTTAINGSVIDMKGFDAVTFIVELGAITAGAVTSIKAQQGAQSNLSDAADLKGTSISIADTDDDKIVALEIEPTERYCRVVVSRATQNAVVDSGLAIQAKAHSVPVTHDASTVIGSEYHGPSAQEGTA